MKFDYACTIMVNGQIDIDNIGDCVLVARNAQSEEWYLLVKTVLGWTSVVEFGPVVPDIDMLTKSTTCKYSRFEFSEGRLIKIIDKFLNDGSRMITQVSISDIEEVEPIIRGKDILTFWMQEGS